MKTKVLISISIFVFLAGCGKSPEDLSSLGEEHLANGEYKLALESYKTLITKHPDNPLSSEVAYKIARIYLDELNDYENGFIALKEVKASYPDSEKGKKAQNDLEQFPNWLFVKAESNRNSKDVTGSIEILTFIVNTFSSHEMAPKAQYLIGDIYMNDLRDFTQAIASYRKVISDFPGSNEEAHAQFMVGYIYANVLNEPENAQNEYKLFLKKFPGHELTPSVKFELEYLGKDINDIPALQHITS